MKFTAKNFLSKISAHKMSIKIAKIVSVLLAPLVIVVPGVFLLVFIQKYNLQIALYWALLLLFFIVPLWAIIFWLTKAKKFSDFDVSTQKQRPLLFAIEAIFTASYLGTAYLFHAPSELFVGVIMIVALLAVMSIVNKFIKASGHLAMLSGGLTLFVLIGGSVYMFGYLLIPVLVWSRLKLKRHTFREVILGIIIGISVSSLVYALLSSSISYPFLH